jgi:REP element-mobilizing transposase RayT
MIPQKGSNLLRKGRASIVNQHYLITTTVIERKPFLSQDEAAEIVLNSLFWIEKRGSIQMDAAVVMPDHLHFVAALQKESLSTVMHSLKRYSARKINLLLKREGPFWQRQYHDHAVRKDEDLNELVQYTLNNPVRAGLVADFRDYPFWYCRWDV